MDALHVHLILNHVPILTSWLGTLLLAFGALRRDAAARRIGLVLLVIAALAAIPVFWSGKAAEEAAERLPAVSERWIDSHEDAATVSLVLVEILGLLSLATLVRTRTRSAAGWLATVALLLGLVTAGQIAWTGLLGGRIRHTEVRPGAVVPAAGEDEREGKRNAG